MIKVTSLLLGLLEVVKSLSLLRPVALARRSDILSMVKMPVEIGGGA
jgi:hypothetical protein